MLLGLGRGPPGRGPPGRGASEGPPGPGRPGKREPPGRGAPGAPGLADWPVPDDAAKPVLPPEPPWPVPPAWPGRGPRCEPMPVAVELNGLLPGRGPGRGGPGVPEAGRDAAPGRGAPGPGRGADAGLWVPRAPEDGADGAEGRPAPGVVSLAAAGSSGRPCGNGTGGLARPGASEGWSAGAGLSAAGAAGVACGPSAGAAAGLGSAAGAAGAAGAGGVAGTAPPRPSAPPWPPSAAARSAPADAGAGAAGAAAPTADAAAAGAAAGRPPSPCPARACLGCWAANASLSLRTTGASIVEDADRTNSPISWSLAITALLSTPNSLASSYTRTFATALPLLGPAPPDLSAGRGSACSVRRQLLLFIAECSSVAHRNLSLLSRAGLPRPCRSCRTGVMTGQTPPRLRKVPGERVGAERSRLPQRPRERPAALRLLEALLAWVQVRPPARPPRPGIGNDLVPDRHHAKQVVLGRTGPAAQTRPNY